MKINLMTRVFLLVYGFISLLIAVPGICKARGIMHRSSEIVSVIENRRNVGGVDRVDKINLEFHKFIIVAMKVVMGLLSALGVAGAIILGLAIWPRLLING
jgi:hypothetical protein